MVRFPTHALVTTSRIEGEAEMANRSCECLWDGCCVTRADPQCTNRAGNLALSRALGDFEFKQSPQLDAEHQVVTADPDINIHEHTSEDEFLVIACDGTFSLS